MRSFPISTLLAAAVFAGILLGVRAAVSPARGLNPATLTPAFAFPAPAAPVRQRPLPAVPEALAIADPDSPGWSPAAAANLSLTTAFLTDNASATFGPPSGLDHFYAALRDLATHARTHPVRIVHYGDSPTTADLITGDARELLQDKFGNAGPGFILPAKPWAWYSHRGVDVSATGWIIATAVGQQREGVYGLGGASFIGVPGTQSTLHLISPTASSIELQFLTQPGGGSIEVSADGTPVGIVSTAADAKHNGAATIALPLGSKSILLRVQNANVELFGVAVGTKTTGLTYDSIGLNGASTTVMSRAFSPQNFSEALAHRDPDLVVINYGTNEAGYLDFVNKQYEGELRRAITLVQSAVPHTSILIMSPMDRGSRSGTSDDQAIQTMPAIPRLVEIQQRVAADTGCAFFNTYASMGGEDTMNRWYNGHPRLVAADLIHPTPQGARIVAQSLTGQLLIGYERYLQRHAAKPVPPAQIHP